MDGIAAAAKVRELDKACRIVLATNSRSRAMDQALEELREKGTEYVRVKNRQGQYRIPIGEIVFAESKAKIVTIHTLKEGEVSFSDRLDSFSLQCGDLGA